MLLLNCPQFKDANSKQGRRLHLYTLQDLLNGIDPRIHLLDRRRRQAVGSVVTLHQPTVRVRLARLDDLSRVRVDLEDKRPCLVLDRSHANVLQRYDSFRLVVLK